LNWYYLHLLSIMYLDVCAMMLCKRLSLVVFKGLLQSTLAQKSP